MSEVNLSSFLEIIASDHQQFSFPINEIQKEITIMYLDSSDFNEGLMKAYSKLKRKYNDVTANIFLTVVEMVLHLKELDVRVLSDIEYQQQMDILIDTLNSLKITRIDKRSPDGQMLTTMAGG